MSQGVKRIAAERERQIKDEGWTPKHDDEHEDCSLAYAAICYAAPEQIYVRQDFGLHEVRFVDPWPPWTDGWDKRPKDGKTPTAEQYVRQLEKAGALIAAEIDRMLRVLAQRKKHRLQASRRKHLASRIKKVKP